MPELIVDGKNSLFIERNITDLKKKMIFYRDNRKILIEHGKRIQQEIIDNWSWKKQNRNYKKMFDEVLR